MWDQHSLTAIHYSINYVILCLWKIFLSKDVLLNQFLFWIQNYWQNTRSLHRLYIYQRGSLWLTRWDTDQERDSQFLTHCSLHTVLPMGSLPNLDKATFKQQWCNAIVRNTVASCGANRDTGERPHKKESNKNWQLVFWKAALKFPFLHYKEENLTVEKLYIVGLHLLVQWNVPLPVTSDCVSTVGMYNRKESAML